MLVHPGLGATILEGYLPGERFPLSGPRGQSGAMCMLGTFSQYGVIHQNSAVAVDDDLPLDKAVLVGCGVPTGFGSAVNTADVRAGDTVVVRRGRHRHQRRAGRALRRREVPGRGRPGGQGADSAIITVGLVDAEVVGNAVGKGGGVVITGLNKLMALDEIITRTYRLDEVHEGYDDLMNGKNVRGVIVHEH